MQRGRKESAMVEDKRDEQEKIPYVTPSIVTLSEEQILEEIGPARAYTGALPFSF